jgi:hypothetical protein
VAEEGGRGGGEAGAEGGALKLRSSFHRVETADDGTLYPGAFCKEWGTILAKSASRCLV